MTNVNWMKISRISDFYIILSNIYLWYTKSVLIRPRLFLGEIHPSYFNLQGYLLYLYSVTIITIIIQMDLHINISFVAGLYL